VLVNLTSCQMLYTLVCIVIGETNPFVVDINEDRLVAHLKKAIKKEAEHALGAFDAHTLTLYQVHLNPKEEEYHKKLQEAFRNPSKNKELDPLDELKDVFPTGPTRRMIQILVQPPEGELPDSRAKLPITSESIDQGLWCHC
jgi:Crinkler effector protein N-terminal domain